VPLLPVTRSLAALTTTMKSPVSTWGVNSGLCLPRRRWATSGGDAGQNQVLGVDHKPVALDFMRLGEKVFIATSVNWIRCVGYCYLRATLAGWLPWASKPPACAVPHGKP